MVLKGKPTYDKTPSLYFALVREGGTQLWNFKWESLFFIADSTPKIQHLSQLVTDHSAIEFEFSVWKTLTYQFHLSFIWNSGLSCWTIYFQYIYCHHLEMAKLVVFDSKYPLNEKDAWIEREEKSEWISFILNVVKIFVKL